MLKIVLYNIGLIAIVFDFRKIRTITLFVFVENKKYKKIGREVFGEFAPKYELAFNCLDD